MTEPTVEPTQPLAEATPESPAEEAPSSKGSDFALLSSKDEYTRYFTLLERVWRALMRSYELSESENTYEASVVRDYLERLLYTVETLRMKYTHSPTDQRMLWINLANSGLPNAQEISTISVDLLHRESRLRNLPAEPMIKQLVLDYMFKYHEDPLDFLWQLAERRYLDMLEESKLFLPFMLEEDNFQKQASVRKDMRTYLASWACYDFATSRPYIHVMSFDQNNEVFPLEKRKANHLKLVELIRAEGSRVPDVGILAMAIDDALESIHPKILKRIGLGPLYTPLLLNQEGVELDDKHQAMADLFNDYGEEDDFIFTMTDEIIFSKSQRVTTSIFSPNGRVREIFHIPETDPESYARRASVIHKHVLMPHHLAQHLDDSIVARVPELKGARVLTYDASGNVHGV